jgi:hypothetical protein
MRVFLSYSAADRKLAERLRDELSRDGLSIWTGTQSRAETGWQQQIEEAIRSADDILILVGPKSSDDAAQQLTWRVALEAAWQDSHKRLIPILLRDAALPRFVFGDAAGGETPVVRILDPRDLRSAAQAILGALQRDGQKPPVRGASTRGLERGSTKKGFAGPSPDDRGSDLSPSTEVGTKADFSFAVEAERSDRLQELEKFAESLKR